MSKRECLKKLSPRSKKLSALIKALPRYWLWLVWPTSMPRPAGKPRARKILAELQKLSEHSYVQATDLALVYAGLGDKDKAFAWLDKAYEERSFSLINLKVEPRFDFLHSDARFADLLRRIGLTQ